MNQPEGLQRDLLKCSRVSREWVLSLSNEIDRLRELAIDRNRKIIELTDALALRAETLDDEISRLTAENAELKIAAKLYYRCNGCGGIIVRAPGNTAPCEQCDSPLGRPMMPDLWWHSENVRLTSKLAEAREAARTIWVKWCNIVYRDSALARWPWLEEETTDGRD